MNKINRNFSQLSETERAGIEVLLQAGKSKRYIAEQLGRHISTIYRELSRNTAKRGSAAKVYKADRAHHKAELRHKLKAKSSRFCDCLKHCISQQIITQKLSPQLICGRMKQEGNTCVSHETIYKWIWSCKHGNRRKDQSYKQLHKHLKQYGRRRKRRHKKNNRGCLQYRKSIEQRPKRANKRQRLGDKEMDIILGKNRQAGLLIIQDRKTRFSRLEKLTTKSAAYMNKKISKTIDRFEHGVKTITTDNDLAFANHYLLDVPVYFTHPYSSHEKGSVENRIGILRRFFPKNTDFTKITTREIKKVEKLLNQRPMKMFNYESPSEQYYKFAFIN